MLTGAIGGALLVALALFWPDKWRPKPREDKTRWGRLGVVSALLLIGGTAALALFVSMTK